MKHLLTCMSSKHTHSPPLPRLLKRSICHQKSKSSHPCTNVPHFLMKFCKVGNANSIFSLIDFCMGGVHCAPQLRGMLFPCGCRTLACDQSMPQLRRFRKWFLKVVRHQTSWLQVVSIILEQLCRLDMTKTQRSRIGLLFNSR